MTSWLRIGDVVERTGLTHRTLRHYDELGLLSPSGRSSGDYRLYSEDDLRRLLAIQHLKSLGLGLAEIARALDDPDFDAAAELDRHIATTQQRIASETELLARLQRLRDGAASSWDEVLDAIALTERLHHPDAAVRFRATLDAPTHVPVGELVDLLRADPADSVREVATWALVQHGETAVAQILPHLADPDPAVRLQMAHALGKLAQPATIPALAGLLADPDEAVAAKAAFSLGQIAANHPDAADPLIGAVGSARPLLRDAISVALERTTSGEDALIALLESANPRAKEQAAEILGHRGAAAATGGIAGLLDDPDQDVRQTAILALGLLDNEEAGRAIAGALDSADERVRLIAERLLRSR